MKRIFVCDEMHPSLFEMLDGAGFAYTYQPKAKRDEILEQIADYEGLMIRNKTRVDEAFLQAATRLEFIGRAGAGLDLIDREACDRHHVRLFAANAGNMDAVGEHALGMLLALLNHIHTADREVRQKIWLREANRGTELGGKTVGLIGYGHNGQAFAKRLSGFNVNVLAYDKYRDHYSDAYAKQATVEQLFEQADVLSLHIPLTEETSYLVREDFISQFQKPFYLINCSRGEIVQLAAVLQGLQSGKILGACLDVLENEKLHQLPAGPDEVFDSLIQLPNVIFTPHVAGWTHESYVRINEVLVQQIAEAFGQPHNNQPITKN
ncbi:phosphoglycerate dehydrogenase [Siphonobacter sp. BAB-5405]|uniref:NAD(P)-dependent oxidoreductase n=1 Tax=Siphonobacter sp. BAB-5405 TaxID=1864825 RepID=UPI000C8035D1|nr:NAD(P)-dependent oxidoreductase [Siphonobacter sp. BAB-5405]PMD94575.1 phosphoglycerate dehydrogenase [Siphonobacter sp. BAB-5405]